MPDIKSRILPPALPPTAIELEEWNALSREEQMSRYREALAHPDCAAAADETMAEILEQAQARFADRRG